MVLCQPLSQVKNGGVRGLDKPARQTDSTGLVSTGVAARGVQESTVAAWASAAASAPNRTASSSSPGRMTSRSASWRGKDRAACSLSPAMKDCAVLPLTAPPAAMAPTTQDHYQLHRHDDRPGCQRGMVRVHRREGPGHREGGDDETKLRQALAWRGLTNGGPGTATLAPGLDMHQSVFHNHQYGCGMAIGTLLFVAMCRVIARRCPACRLQSLSIGKSPGPAAGPGGSGDRGLLASRATGAFRLYLMPSTRMRKQASAAPSAAGTP